MVHMGKEGAYHNDSLDAISLKGSAEHHNIRRSTVLLRVGFCIPKLNNVFEFRTLFIATLS